MWIEDLVESILGFWLEAIYGEYIVCSVGPSWSIVGVDSSIFEHLLYAGIVDSDSIVSLELEVVVRIDVNEEVVSVKHPGDFLNQISVGSS